MSLSIGDALLKLGVDTGELDRGLGEVKGKLGEISTAWAGVGVGIIGGMGMMTKAAADEQSNINRLAITLKNVGVAYDHVKDSLEATITATQRKTGVADSEQRDVLNRLLLVTNDYNKALELLPTALDLAAAGGIDAATAATYLGKAYIDLGNGAEQVSVRFGQASLQFKNMEDIQKRVSGAAEAAANPFAVLKAEIGDIAEGIGKSFLPVLKDLISHFTEVSGKVQEWVAQNPELVKALAAGALAVAGLITAVFALKAALILLGTTANLMFGGILIAVGALVTGGVLLWQNWDKVTRRMEGALISLKIAFLENIAKILDSLAIFTQFIPGLNDLVDRAREKISGMIEVEKVKKDLREVQDALRESEEILANTPGATGEFTQAVKENTDALKEQEEQLQEQKKAYETVAKRVRDVIDQSNYERSAAGHLGITLNDVIATLHDMGISSEEITRKLVELGDKGDDVNAVLDAFALNAMTVAIIVGKQKDEIDKLTASFKGLTEAATGTKTAMEGLGITPEQAAAGAHMMTFSAYELSALGKAYAAKGYSQTQIGNILAEYSAGVPTYQHGGLIKEPTLLYGLKTRQVYAKAHEGEAVSPEAGGGYKTANIYLTLDGRTIAEVMGVHLVDLIRLRTGVKL